VKIGTVPVFLLLLALIAGASAQTGKVYRIGVLDTLSASANRTNMDALLRGLREAGYVEGKNLVIDYRWTEGRSERAPELAAALVRAKPDVIMTRATPATLAAKNASSIPVVMIAIANPVGTGVVANLARPGGHVTGLTSLVTEVYGKRMEIVRDLLPGVKRIGVFLNSTNPNTPTQAREVERAARALGLEVRVFDVRDAQTLQRAIDAAAAEPVGAMLVNAEPLMSANRALIVEHAAKHRLPVIYASREFVDGGGLVSYGVHYPDLYYRAAFYVDKILKGAKPGDLPIEQPTKFELVINLKTAKALGIKVTRDFALRADEVIQ
jgi:putative ABC transport system substrate-binding protein